jgi:hypothetical protein
MRFSYKKQGFLNYEMSTFGVTVYITGRTGPKNKCYQRTCQEMVIVHIQVESRSHAKKSLSRNANNHMMFPQPNFMINTVHTISLCNQILDYAFRGVVKMKQKPKYLSRMFLSNFRVQRGLLLHITKCCENREHTSTCFEL